MLTPGLVMGAEWSMAEAIGQELVGTDYAEISSNVELLLSDQSEYDKMAKAVSPYGDGNASQKILDFILIDI